MYVCVCVFVRMEVLVHVQMFNPPPPSSSLTHTHTLSQAGSSESLGKLEKGDRRSNKKNRNSLMIERTPSELARERGKKSAGKNHKRIKSWAGNKLLEADPSGECEEVRRWWGRGRGREIGTGDKLMSTSITPLFLFHIALSHPHTLTPSHRGNRDE